MKRSTTVLVLGAAAFFLLLAMVPGQIKTAHSANPTQPQQVDGEPMPSAAKHVRRTKLTTPEVSDEKDDPLVRIQTEYKGRGRITSTLIKRRSVRITTPLFTHSPRSRVIQI
jgi:hypothetical protein